MDQRTIATACAAEGEAAFRADNLEESMRHFLAAVEADPEWSRAWNDLGAVAWTMGRIDDAVTAFRTALKLDPNDSDALSNLAETLAQCDATLRGVARSDADPFLSVIVPTYERATVVNNLLNSLVSQDLSPSAFEVIVVDDGSATPLSLAANRYPFKLEVLHQPNAGPAAARNLALTRAKAPWILIFNDDAVPAPDVLRRHLTRQLQSDQDIAVLGRFDFLPEKLAHPFTQLMQRTNLMFEYTLMKPNALNDWRFFYTCNMSIPRRCLDAVGGFDANFPHAICEDTELGWRLQKQCDLRVFFDPLIVAHHDHDMDIDRYVKRQFLLGLNTHRMYRKHGEPRLIYRPTAPDAAFWSTVRQRVENDEPVITELVAQVRLAQAAPLPASREAADNFLRDLGSKVQRISTHECLRGQLAAEHGFTAAEARGDTDLNTKLTSVVIPNLNGFPHLKEALSSLRKHTTGPFETIIVDNGSTDGSLQWLRQQKDIRLMEMGRNVGAPAARNRALENIRGETVLFCDNDVIFTPNWREILLAHLGAWKDVGIVGPMSDYVSGGQKSNLLPGKQTTLDAFSTSFHTARKGEHAYTSRLILFFMLCRREVINQIGGIDERYGRWGFEDDDYCIRARRAGWQLRIAKDCFVRHLGSRTSKTANIDYNKLLLENWEVFKRKWNIDPALAYGTQVDLNTLLVKPFDPVLDKCSLGGA
ncbi:MAG: glycosyltransferase [Planctomycetes bacterium]|nr:glycosyltransferase [Planctomycetota bacterium]